MIETLGYKKNNLDREKDDFYATPPMEVANILNYENISGTVLEPCCGMGHMVQGILESGFKGTILATDLIDRGFGIGNLDFLSEKYPYTEDVDNIIINPPFKLIEEFVNKSIEIAKNKVIVFARNQFAEGQSRYEKIFKNNPTTRIYQYVDRVACAKCGDFNKTLSSNMAFGWFIWDKHDSSKKTTFN